jgi:ferrous iron transport protein B
MIVALNMVDMAARDGLEIDTARLAAELGVPVVPTVAVRKRGLDELRAALDRAVSGGGKPVFATGEPRDITQLQREARRIATAVTVQQRPTNAWTQRLDRVALHPVIGPILLAALMFVMFQAVFSWSQTPIDWLASAQAWLADAAIKTLPDGFFRSLLVEGVINGVGSVVAFLPQILILFAFILVLEASG